MNTHRIYVLKCVFYTLVTLMWSISSIYYKLSPFHFQNCFCTVCQKIRGSIFSSINRSSLKESSPGYKNDFRQRKGKYFERHLIEGFQRIWSLSKNVLLLFCVLYINLCLLLTITESFLKLLNTYRKL